MKPQIIIKCLIWLGHHLKVDNINCEFYSYFLSLAKLFNIKTKIRIFIFNPIISEKECFSMTKLFYLFSLFTVIYKGGRVFNMSFSSRYIKIVVNWLYPSFAKNALNLKSFFKTINDIFITNDFDVSA